MNTGPEITAEPETSGDRIAFVVGGSGGLGTAICRSLAAAGWRVIFSYRSRRAAAERLVNDIVTAGGKADCAYLDLSECSEIQDLLARVATQGAIDAVIYAAGPDIPQRFVSQTSPADWGRFATEELSNFFNLVHAALPHLRNSAPSCLIATTSCATHRVIPGDVLSAVPKAGINMLIRQIAREEGRFGIRANCVAPGIIDAGLGQKAQEEFYTPEIWASQRKSIPLRRFGTSEAIADAVLFLVGHTAHYITGQTIIVDGGHSV